MHTRVLRRAVGRAPPCVPPLGSLARAAKAAEEGQPAEAALLLLLLLQLLLLQLLLLLQKQLLLLLLLLHLERSERLCLRHLRRRGRL